MSFWSRNWAGTSTNSVSAQMHSITFKHLEILNKIRTCRTDPWYIAFPFMLWTLYDVIRHIWNLGGKIKHKCVTKPSHHFVPTSNLTLLSHSSTFPRILFLLHQSVLPTITGLFLNFLFFFNPFAVTFHAVERPQNKLFHCSSYEQFFPGLNCLTIWRYNSKLWGFFCLGSHLSWREA